MITRKIIKKILPTTLPLAAVLISSTFSWQAWALDSKVESKQEKHVKSPHKSHKSENDEDMSSDADSTESPTSGDRTAPCVMPLYAPCNGRVRELAYEASSVYVIRTKYGYQTNIIFDKREEILTISVGDRSLWQIIPAGNRLFIRPLTENLSTNMTLITNKHSYEFDLKSVGKRNESNIYVARFTYPSQYDSMAAAMDTASPQSSKNIKPTAELSPTNNPTNSDQHILKFPPSFSSAKEDGQMIPAAGTQTSLSSPAVHPNYSYTYSGPDALAPLQVYDDGKSTFIKYQTISQTVPSAFIINQNGKESPATTTVQGSSLIVDGVASELALRSSGGEIRVYNESLSQR